MDNSVVSRGWVTTKQESLFFVGLLLQLRLSPLQKTRTPTLGPKSDSSCTNPLTYLVFSAVCLAEADGGRGLCSAGSQSVVELLEAEYQLFKSAVYGSVTGLSSDRQCLLDEFSSLQQRHASLVASLLRSHAHLKQVNCLIG